MANTFYLEILASDRKFFCGDCEMLVFPAIDGEYGIMPNHESMVTCLQAGELRFKVDGQWKYAAVSDGFVDVMPKNVVLLADTVELPEEIDKKRAEAAKLRAQERKRQQQSIKEYYQTEAAMNRALSRLKVSNRKMS